MEATKDLDIPVGAPVWMDYVSSDTDKGVAFYSELFGWEVQDTPPEFEGYRYFTKDGNAVGGCMHNDPSFNMPNVWSIFLHTTDATATETLAKEHGGEVLMPTMKVHENGSFCIVRDPGGAVVSAWQPGTERGFGAMYQPNTPAHFELLTRDYSATVEFYRNVFGWTPHTLADEPEFKYTGFGPAENPRAGIMDASSFLPKGTTPQWAVYMSVQDADATVATAQELGATLVQGIDDTPYGRLAVLVDPTGATFKIQQ